MAVPHSIALAATGLDPENGLGVVKAWVESGGDVNGFFDPDAHEGGREACHPELRALDDGGHSVLLLVVGGSIYDSDNERAYRDRLELIRYLLYALPRVVYLVVGRGASALLQV